MEPPATARAGFSLTAPGRVFGLPRLKTWQIGSGFLCLSYCKFSLLGASDEPEILQRMRGSKASDLAEG